MDFKTVAFESQKHVDKIVGDDYVLINGKYQLKSEVERFNVLKDEEERYLSESLKHLNLLRKKLKI